MDHEKRSREFILSRGALKKKRLHGETVQNTIEKINGILKICSDKHKRRLECVKKKTKEESSRKRVIDEFRPKCKVSVILLNINCPNAPIKRHGWNV